VIGENYLAFGNELCDDWLYRDPNNTESPLYLMRLARVIPGIPELCDVGATFTYSLVVDVVPHMNILNLPYNVVHPPACTLYSELKLKPGNFPTSRPSWFPSYRGYWLLSCWLRSSVNSIRLSVKSATCRVRICITNTFVLYQIARGDSRCHYRMTNSGPWEVPAKGACQPSGGGCLLYRLAAETWHPSCRYSVAPQSCTEPL